MLKEVEADGHIALGKQFAGRRYDLQFHPDGRVELRPVSTAQDSAAELTRLWAQQHADAIGLREPCAGLACQRFVYTHTRTCARTCTCVGAPMTSASTIDARMTSPNFTACVPTRSV